MNLQPPADDPLVGKAADAFQIAGSGAPGCFDFPRPVSTAAIAVGDKAGQAALGRIQIASLGQAGDFLPRCLLLEALILPK